MEYLFDLLTAFIYRPFISADSPDSLDNLQYRASFSDTSYSCDRYSILSAHDDVERDSDIDDGRGVDISDLRYAEEIRRVSVGA